jgi:ferritin-like metal-binding protein YciE
MKHSELRKLYIDELRDLYDAENRLVKALPRLAKASTSVELRAAIEEHLEQTRGHVDRLTEILDTLGEKPAGKKCAGMIGLIKEGGEIMEADFEGQVMDVAIISAAQRVEHYEIAAYGCIKTWAGLLDESDAGALLEKTLEEEKESDRKLTELSERVNVEAKGSGGEGDESKEAGATRKARAARA